MSPERSSVFVVDDDPVQSFVLSGILRTAGYRVEVFDHPEALLSRLSATDRGCVVLDQRMLSSTGLDVQRALGDRGAALPLIFVSGRAEVLAAVAAMKQGAVDFLPNPVEPRELLAVVERALHEDAEVAAGRAARDLARTRWRELSPREREVCRLLARGLLNKQIAATLGVAESTVQAQRARALKKLGVGSVAELVRWMAHADDEG